MTDKYEKFIDKANVDKFVWRPGNIIILKSRAKKLVKPEGKTKKV